MKRIFALLIISLFTLTSCNLANKINPKAEIPLVESDIFSLFPININDVELVSPPKTIVSLSPALTEIVVELGFQQHLVGKSDYCDFPTTIQNLPKVGNGTNPDFATIYQLKPDLIISTTPIAKKDLIALELEGIQTLVFKGARSLEELMEIYETLALALGEDLHQRETANEVATKLSEKLEEFSADKGSFAYITAEFSVAGTGTLEDSVFSLIGENIAKNQDYNTALEKVVEKEPDFLIVSDIYTLDNIQAHSKLSTLPCVEEGKVYFVDNMLFERPSGRIYQVLENIK